MDTLATGCWSTGDSIRRAEGGTTRRWRGMCWLTGSMFAVEIVIEPDGRRWGYSEILGLELWWVKGEVIGLGRKATFASATL